MWLQGDTGWRRINGRKKWENYNSIINTIYLKKRKDIIYGPEYITDCCLLQHITRRDPKKPEIIFWRADLLQYKLSPLGECSRNLSVLVYRWWCYERLYSASVNFFEDSTHFPFHEGLFRSIPAHFALSEPQVLNKNSMTPVTQSCPSNFFLFPQMKKVLKGKCFADMEEVKQNTAKALKGIKFEEFKNCFEQWRKV